VSFTNPIAAGSFIGVATAIDTGVATFAISDGHGDTFTNSVLGVVTNGAIGARMQVGAFLAPASGAQTVTITPNVNFAFCEIIVWEIAGVTSPVIDKAVTAAQSGTAGGGFTPSSGTTGTLSAASEAAIGYGVLDQDSFGTSGAGWTLDAITAFSDLAEHQIISSTTAIAATGTTTGGGTINTQMFCVTFMAGGASDTLGGSMQVLMM
jgi:hypothetical protein